MKKSFLLFAALLLIVEFCYSEGHMTFKGIEINGSIQDFNHELAKQGYVENETNSEGTAVLLIGKFAGFDNCSIAVFATPIEKQVYAVYVALPEQDSWYTLKSRYNELKASLTNKYGNPDTDIHTFISPYYEGDGYELQALRMNKCTYASYYMTSLGRVIVSITEAGYGKGNIAIVYQDEVNHKLKENAIQDEMNNDL